MTARELELFRLAVAYALKYDNSNPDVGMGPIRRMLARQVAAKLSFRVTEDEINQAAVGPDV